MIKHTVFLFILIISCQSLFSQSRHKELEAYIQNFQYQKALECIESQTPTKDLQIQQAFCNKALGNYRPAIKILKPLSEEYPDDARILADLAQCYEAMGNRQAGIECYDNLIRIDSINAYFRMQKAELLFQDGEYAKALELFQDIYDQNGYNNTLKRSALCFQKMNEPDSARHYFSLAWEVDSTDSFSASSLINLHLKSGYYGNGILLSDIYMKRDSTNRQINLLNALSYYGADMYEEAIKRFGKCYNEGDTSLVVNRSLGIAHYSMNDSDSAQPFLATAFRQDTTNNNVLYCLAVACSDMGDYRKAIPYFLKLLDRTIPPEMTLYLYYRNLAIAYEKVSKMQEAADAYNNALKHANENQQMNICYSLGNIYQYWLKDTPKALEYYKQYKTAITNYLANIKAKEDTTESEIKETEERIGYLNNHITDLEKSISPKK